MPLVRIGAAAAGSKPRPVGAHKRDREKTDRGVYKPDWDDAEEGTSRNVPPWKKSRLSSSSLGVPGSLPIGMKPMKPTEKQAPPKPSSKSPRVVGAKVGLPDVSDDAGSEKAGGSSSSTSEAHVPLLKTLPKRRPTQPTQPKQPPTAPPKQPPAGASVVKPHRVASRSASNIPRENAGSVVENAAASSSVTGAQAPKTIPPKPGGPTSNPSKKVAPTPPQTVPPKPTPPTSNPSKKITPITPGAYNQTVLPSKPTPPPTPPTNPPSNNSTKTTNSIPQTVSPPPKPSQPTTIPPKAGSTIQRILQASNAAQSLLPGNRGSPDPKQAVVQTAPKPAVAPKQEVAQSTTTKIKPLAKKEAESGEVQPSALHEALQRNPQWQGQAGELKKAVQIRPVAKAKPKASTASADAKGKVVAPPGRSTGKVVAPPTPSGVIKHMVKPKAKPGMLKPTIKPSFAARQAKSIKTKELENPLKNICWDFVNSGYCTRGNRCPYQHKKVSQAELASSMRQFTAEKARMAREKGGNSEATENLEALFKEAGLNSDSGTVGVLPQDALWKSKCHLTPDSSGKETAIVVRITMEHMSMGDEAMLLWCYWLNQKLMEWREEMGEDNIKQITIKATEINFSGNALGVYGLRALCALLEKYGLRCAKLNLDNNKVDDVALKEITRHLTNFDTAPVEELFLHNNKLSPKGLCWLLTSVAMHPAYPISCDPASTPLGQRSGKFKPLSLHLDQTSFSDGVGDDMGLMLQDVSGACFVTICTGKADIQVASTKWKHNLVVSLQCRTNWLSLPPVRPENHAKPLFSEPPIKSTVLFNSKRTTPCVLYEYDKQVVIYKPAGWICDPKGAQSKAHLIDERTRQSQCEKLCRQDENASIAHWSSLHFGGNEQARATRNARLGFGMCHRLDAGTSGPVLYGKTDDGYNYGCTQIGNRDCVKDYVALVHGDVLEERGACRKPIDKSGYQTRRMVECSEDGDPALTIWEVMAKYESPRNHKDRYTLLHFRIVTGRTHQIRVHCSHMGHPIVSDWTYAKAHQNENWTLEQDSAMCNRIFLHKFRLAFVDMEGYVCSVPCPLQMAPELWNCLKQLRLVGGIALHDCGAPGLPKASWSRG